MATIKVYNDNFEKAIRKFKKQVMNENILQEIRERQYFVKPCQKRNRAKAAAKMRWRKKQREMNPKRDTDF